MTVAGIHTADAADSALIAGMFRTGKYSDCVEATAKAITESELNENYRVLKIRSELELGRYSDAAESLDAGLKKFPTSIELRWLGRHVARFNNQPQRVAELEEEIAKFVQQTPWRYSDASSRLTVGRFLLSLGVDPKKVLDGMYNVVKKQQPSYAPAFLACGELALEKNDFALAAQNFEQAAKLDTTDADAHFGLAQAFLHGDTEKANAAIKAAIERNPNHIGCLQFVVDGHIDSERYGDAETILDQVESINPLHPRAAAYLAVLAHLRNQPESEKQCRGTALKHWTTNPEVDSLIGKKLSQKYRFAEGAAHQRQALEVDAKFLPARMQLASDLLRLGQEEEGWKLANEVYEADGYNIFAHNLVTLQESIAKFRTLEEDGIVARMDAREADIYGRRVLDLLKRAKRDLCAKYEVTLPSPIIVEMFPKQEDFAIRTFGLPGGAGFLGVCFGTVITANSPASQDAHPTSLIGALLDLACGGTEFADSVVVHQPVTLPSKTQAGPIVVRTPDGQEKRLEADLSTFSETDQPGIYRAKVGSTETRFAVNLSPTESHTAPLNLEQLEQRGVRFGADLTRVERIDRERQQRDTELESRQKVWRWLIVVALATLILETWWAGRAEQQVIAGGPTSQESSRNSM